MYNLVFYVPSLLVYVTGLVLSLVRWRLHPRTSLLVSVACGLGLANHAFSITVRFLVPALGIANSSNLFMLTGLFSACLYAVVVGLFLAAALFRTEPVARPS